MNIYVGNIAYSSTEEDLGNLFSEYGNVTSVKIIKDKYSGRSKGFGFIEMESEESGERAVAELDGREVGGRNLRVNKAHSREDN
jgi:RNA recognition motif-containing protein